MAYKRAFVFAGSGLPILEDFESTSPGLIPGGWTNAQLRYVTTELDDGNTVLMKTARLRFHFIVSGMGLLVRRNGRIRDFR